MRNSNGRARLLAGVIFVAALAPLAAMAANAPLTLGDRVTVDGKPGVVIDGPTTQANGEVEVKVHLDSLPAGFPTVGAWYPVVLSHVVLVSHGTPLGAAPAPAAPPAARPGTPVAAAPRPAAPAPGPAPAPVNTNTDTASAALCQQLIRGNYPNMSDGTQTVTFKTFQLGAPHTYEAIAAGDMVGARGHQVQSWPVTTTFQVLTHHNGPQSPDELRTYSIKYECYKSPVTGWTIEETSRTPGGETPQYIYKQ